MSETVRLRIRRSPAGEASGDCYQQFDVPHVEGMSVMDALDYIYEEIDGGIAYYDHAACNQGICRRCLAQINGQTGLMCQTLVVRDTTVEPLPSRELERDLVTKRGRARDE